MPVAVGLVGPLHASASILFLRMDKLVYGDILENAGCCMGDITANGRGLGNKKDFVKCYAKRLHSREKMV
jgi:hypothetical protein